MSAALLAVQGLSMEYRSPGGRTPVLRGIDLAVPPGEIVGLVGESGSGKSTLAFAILRHLAPGARISAGRILFEGQDLVTASPARIAALRGRRIAMLFQDPSTALNPAMRLGEQVAEGLRHHRGLAGAAAEASVAALFGAMRLSDPAAMMRRFPHEVSGGEKQRVVLAMAMAGDPALLVMDEPTTALDATTTMGILALISALQAERRMGVLYISHDLGNVARIASRVAVIYAGSIVEQGPTAQVLGAPGHPYTRMLMASLPNPWRTAERRRLAGFGPQPSSRALPAQGCRFAPRCPLAEDACRTVSPPLTGAGAHRTACLRAGAVPTFVMPVAAAAPEPSARAPLLVAEHVSVAYGRATVPAVSDVTLAIATGETLGLVGESGSGKSSFAKALIGLAAATGTITLGGQPVAALRGRDRRQVQMVFQHPEQSLNPTMTVGQSLARPLSLYDGLAGSVLRRAVDAWLERVRLPAAFATRYPNELSGGEKQRVAIARAFAARPALVLCDEVTTGLDASVQAAVLNLLTELQLRDGTALLLISHDLNIVQHFADRMAVMHRGRLVELRPVHGLSAPPYHPYTEALLAAMPIAEPRLLAREVTLREGTRADSFCLFAGQCARRLDHCCSAEPPVRAMADGHWIRCHLRIEALAAMPSVWRLPG